MPTPPEPTAVIAACRLGGDGGTRELSRGALSSWQPGDGALWLHLDRKLPETAAWLRSDSGLDPILVDALLAEETRPRAMTIGESLLVILRGVNLNPGADPEDMVSLRIWIDRERVVSLRGPRVLAVQDMRDEITAGRGPQTPGEWLVAMAGGLVHRMGPVLDDLEDELDSLEEELLDGGSHEVRTSLSALRRRAITLRRYIAPQRDVLARLASETALPWLTDRDRARLREIADRVTRYVEDLDATRERAAVTQEEYTARLNDQMNRTMYVLSLVAAIFLPISFLTGLLGINVGGIPLAESDLGFALVCLALAVIAILELVFFQRRRWF